MVCLTAKRAPPLPCQINKPSPRTEARPRLTKEGAGRWDCLPDSKRCSSTKERTSGAARPGLSQRPAIGAAPTYTMRGINPEFGGHRRAADLLSRSGILAAVSQSRRSGNLDKTTATGFFPQCTANTRHGFLRSRLPASSASRRTATTKASRHWRRFIPPLPPASNRWRRLEGPLLVRWRRMESRDWALL